MTLSLIVPSFKPRLHKDVRTDRASRELRAYLRSEWGGDAPWLYPPAPRTPWRARLRGWWAARRSTSLRSPQPSADLPSAGISYAPSATEDPEDCPHADVEQLGFSGATLFVRCSRCGDVLILRGARQWRVASEDVACPAEPVEA